jgi:hypothetical protein
MRRWIPALRALPSNAQFLDRPGLEDEDRVAEPRDGDEEERLGLGEDRSDELREEEERLGVDRVGELREGLGVE